MGADRTATMPVNDRIAEAMWRSIPLLPAAAGDTVRQMLQPQAVLIVTATIALWAGSHFFGVGEIVDIILLVVGVFAVGWSVFDGAGALCAFATTAVDATSSGELDIAARHFADAVTILGIGVISALLLKGQARTVIPRGRPRIYPRYRIGQPPPSGGLRLTRPATIEDGVLGTTDAFGRIAVSRAQPLSEQRLTLLHELVHRYFSPRTGPLLRFRAELNMSAYARSALLRYLEEALAEGYAQLRVNGLAAAVRALRFPIDGGYLTVAEGVAELNAIGTIVLVGTTFSVTLTRDADAPKPPR